MRKALWSTAALIALLSGAGLIWGPGARAADSSVAMGSSSDALKFLPPEVTIPVGGTVEWHNDNDLQHDVEAEDGSFKSGKLLNKGEKYSFKFTKAGEYKYFCNPHESAGMTGVIKVGAATTPSTAASTTTTTAVGATTTTTPPSGSTTTTTAKAGTGISTTTTAGAPTTTAPSATTPTSAPETATTAPAQGSEQAASGEEHSSETKDEDDDESSPIGIAFAAVSTVLLAGISGKLLASKS
jgi:plastocyanin